MFALVTTMELGVAALAFLLLFGSAWVPAMARRAGRTKRAVDDVADQLAPLEAGYRSVDSKVKNADRVVSKTAKLAKASARR